MTRPNAAAGGARSRARGHNAWSTPRFMRRHEFDPIDNVKRAVVAVKATSAMLAPTCLVRPEFRVGFRTRKEPC